jgi:hypothetical protein
VLPATPLDVVLPEAVHARAVRFLGTTGDLWREAMGRGDEPLAIPPAEGGPFLVGRIVRLDPRLYHAATAPVLALVHATGSSKSLDSVLDSLVDAMARLIAEDSPFSRR